VTADVEFRCVAYPGVLFGRLRLGEEGVRIVEGNLVEFACRSCRREACRAGSSVALVLHRFNLLGELIETDILNSDG